MPFKSVNETSKDFNLTEYSFQHIMTTTDTTGHRALEEAIDDSSATDVSRKKLAKLQEELLVSEIVLTVFTIINFIVMYSFLWMNFGKRSTLFKALTIFHMADVRTFLSYSNQKLTSGIVPHISHFYLGVSETKPGSIRSTSITCH